MLCYLLEHYIKNFFRISCCTNIFLNLPIISPSGTLSGDLISQNAVNARLSIISFLTFMSLKSYKFCNIKFISISIFSLWEVFVRYCLNLFPHIVIKRYTVYFTFFIQAYSLYVYCCKNVFLYANYAKN